jgi:hypothetical protein
MFAPFNPQRNREHREYSHGILTYAFGVEYQEQALLLALSAIHSLGLPVTVVVDTLRILELSENPMINVVSLKGRWSKFEYETTALDITPYDITFKTDADMLFPRGCMLYHAPGLPFTSGVACDIFGTPSNSTAYRETEVSMGLPSVYSACFSFDKHQEESKQFFESLKRSFDHWYTQRVWDLLPNAVQKLIPTTDTAYSIAHLEVVGAARIDGNRFIHCKPYINHWTHEQWTQSKTMVVSRDLDMFLDGVKLTQPFHYFDKELMKDESVTKRIRNVRSLQEA